MNINKIHKRSSFDYQPCDFQLGELCPKRTFMKRIFSTN